MNEPAEIDLALLRDSGWFSGSVEIHGGAATGSGYGACSVRTPLTELLEKEALEEDGSAEYLEQRKRWMVEGAMLIIREAVGAGPRVDLVDIGLTIAVWAWDISLPPMDEMSQAELGELAAQTRAAICERHKVKAERKKVKAGMKGTKTQRQKTSEMVLVYSDRAKGNRNRAREGMSDALRRVG
jgi:hypothetical protein